MRVVVGSTNPVKVGAVRAVFEKYFPSCEVVGVKTDSGVSEQPMSEEETIKGAKNRAKNALQVDVNGEMDFGVGLEGGVCEIDGKLFECAWVAVVKKLQIKNSQIIKYEEGLGGGLYFELPDKIAERIRGGEELGPIMAELLKYDVKRTDGAIGVFSKGELGRQRAYEQIVVTALLKFVSSEWYEQSS